MKSILAIALGTLALTGCSNQPMTPQQQALILQMMQNNQAAVVQENQNAAVIAAGAQQHAPINCLTSYNGDLASTTCQ